MVSWLGLLALGVALALLARAAWLGTELFRIRATDSKLALERGRLPPALFDEIADIVHLYRVQSAVIRAVLSGGRARLVFEHDGSSAGAEQPLRNVIGRFTVTQLRSGWKRAS